MCQANPSPATSSSSHPRVIEGRAGCARVKQPRTSTSTLHGSSTPLKWIRGMPSKSPRCSYIRASASTSSYRSLRSLALINEWIFLFINSNLMATRAPVWSSWPSYLHCANSQTMMCPQRTRLTVGSYTPPKPPRPISLRSFHLRTDEGASGSLFFTFFMAMLLHRHIPRSFTATSGEFLGQGIFASNCSNTITTPFYKLLNSSCQFKRAKNLEKKHVLKIRFASNFPRPSAGQ